MVGWVILAVYLLGWVASVPFVTRWCLYDECDYASEIDDVSVIAFALFCGAFFALFWPPIAGWQIIVRTGTLLTIARVLEPAPRVADDRDRRIAELERELGIR